MDQLTSFIEYYLPVFIPVFLTVISVLAGIVTRRIDLTLTSLLKIHSDLVLGLFSFVIWALIAFQQTGRIDLNVDYTISLVRVVLLLFGNVTLLIAGLIILNVKWDQLSIAWVKSRSAKWEQMANGTFLLVTFLAVLAPIWLAKERTKPASQQALAVPYLVAVPYVDWSIANQLGVRRWNNRLLCEVREVRATSVEGARDAALKYMETLGRLKAAVLPPKGQALPVSVFNERIVIGRP